MCDYSLQKISSRPAQIGDKLKTRDFGTGTRGFAAIEAPDMAVCLLPGTEIAFPEGIVLVVVHSNFPWWKRKKVTYRTAIFRQVNKETPCAHHDALEFPDGHTVLLTRVREDQSATVLQLPARPRTEVEAEAQRRVAYSG
jgi:hypothetical protein